MRYEEDNFVRLANGKKVRMQLGVVWLGVAQCRSCTNICPHNALNMFFGLFVGQEAPQPSLRTT
jgi:heterodisulfide reductase subunit C